MVIRDKKGKVTKVYPYGSEEQLRYEQVLEILFEEDKKWLERLLNKKKEEKEPVNQILDDSDKKVIRRVKKKRAKRYNLTETAKILGITRQGLYCWIKKGWVKPRCDYRSYPVFTVFDIEEIIKWHNTIK